MTDKIVVLATCAGEEEAVRIARRLVEKRLAACVNVHGAMRSIYRWQGQVECDPERQVVIKTARGRLSALEARLRALHPYEMPEFVVLSAEAGSAAYLAWVAAEVGSAGP